MVFKVYGGWDGKNCDFLVFFLAFHNFLCQNLPRTTENDRNVRISGSGFGTIAQLARATDF